MTKKTRRQAWLVVAKGVVAAMIFAWPHDAAAQRDHRLNRRIDSLLSAKYDRADIDTNYITRPHTKWTVVGRLKVSGAKIEAMGVRSLQAADEVLGTGSGHFATEMKADYKSTVSVGVSYIGMSLSVALNPAKLLGKYNDYELNFRSYGRRIGFDIAYQDAHNFKGWVEDNQKKRTHLPEDLLKLRTFNVNGYYVFNHRRFSYPAAFAHSYIQRRSAGSFLLAASGQGQHGEVTGTTPLKFKMTNIGLGGGFGYNYVSSSGWLFHLSALPTFIVYSNTSMTMGHTRVPLNYHFPEVIVTGRGAVVKQIGRNRFAGINMVFNFTSIGDKSHLNVRNQKWIARAYFGFRL